MYFVECFEMMNMFKFNEMFFVFEAKPVIADTGSLSERCVLFDCDV